MSRAPGHEPKSSASQQWSRQAPSSREKEKGIPLLLVIFGWGVLLCFGFAVYVTCTFNSPPFDLRKLHKLRPGMSRVEVRAVLGSPRHVYPASSNDPVHGESWSYSRLVSWPIVYVYFDAEGRFREHIYDY